MADHRELISINKITSFLVKFRKDAHYRGAVIRTLSKIEDGAYRKKYLTALATFTRRFTVKLVNCQIGKIEKFSQKYFF